MSVAYRLTRLAEQDLLDIRAFIAQHSPVAAERMLDRFQGCILLLSAQPLIGEARADLRPYLRQMPVGNYVIFYRYIAEEVTIVRVLHGARDFPTLFGSPPT